MQYRKYDFKDAGYLLLTKQIKEFKELKEYLPVTAFCKEIHIGHERGMRLFKGDISTLSLAEMQKAAELLGIDIDDVYRVAARQYKRELKEKSKG